MTFFDVIFIDALVKRNSQVLGLESAELRDITNLKNWLKENGCIAPDETEYLNRRSDLAALGTFTIDRAVNRFQGRIEDLILWLSTKTKKLEKLVSWIDQAWCKFVTSYLCRISG